MTDILNLPDWKAVATRQEGAEYVIEAEYTVLPQACKKCGVIGRLYRHGVKATTYRDSPIRGAPVNILANVQRYKCRDCGETFLQPLGSIQPDMRMTVRCVEYIKTQCLRDTFVRIAEHIGCDDKTIRVLADEHIAALNLKFKPHLPEWLDNEPHVKTAYDLKEAFYAIYDAKTKAESSARLDAWRESVPATMKKGKKSFAPLLTSTRNWRVEMLAVFDYPITSGYTEALNGVAKVINRQGRGYSFEVLRARLLFGKKPSKPHITPVLAVQEELAPNDVEEEAKPKRTSARWQLIEKYDYRCQSCGGIYDQEELHATRMGVMFSDQPLTNLTLMCSHCKVRFHTDGVIHGGPLSTL